MRRGMGPVINSLADETNANIPRAFGILHTESAQEMNFRLENVLCQQMYDTAPALAVHLSLIALAHADINGAVANAILALERFDPFNTGLFLGTNRANIHILLL